MTTRGTLSPSGFPAPSKEPLAGSDHKAKIADDVRAQERLKELNVWAKQGFAEEDAPLIRALNDPDERVRARAQELMVEDWPAEIASGDQSSK